ncbi:invasion associated locus B family protein [Frigidibacter sp. ROC022]|uniref:invasion associated locus B family protein n=1 Tax=Frigidibacter sp. ROC022 TaxID=2971796 RepID=UPI00215B3CB1|nr:invasion associated locus B family protein [Frigidibacter sp. ROC022]MCR8724785.1 invasion associated locus B family protein [Frigidibacter sp. ROC022]
MKLGGLILALAGLSLPAMAQESTNRVVSVTDWSVFVDGDPADCWGVSSPKETKNTDAEGRPKAVRRGDILLFVSFHKGKGGPGEISFTGGYPFAKGSKVTMDIGGTVFELFPEGEWAWSGSSEDDAKIIAAMKAGATALVKARSSRGTHTHDTFSLLGFTAALEEAQKRCQ